MNLRMKIFLFLSFFTIVQVWVSASQKPNVIVITLDTTRADHLGCYGYHHPTTPFIDSLANDGILFQQASCTVPVTLPSHTSIFTGLYPFHTKVRSNLRSVVPDNIPTLASLLKNKGYATDAVIGSLVLHKRFGLDRGFDIYDQEISGARQERSADEVTDRAIKLFRKLPAPFFVWVHYYDPHYPYAPPDSYKSRFKNPYDGEICFMDTQIKRLINTLSPEQLSNTILVIVGDHGEGLGDHGEEEHGYLLYQSTVHVPLIVYWKNHLKHRVVTQSVSIASITPTLLEALDINDTGSAFDLPSLWPCVTGNQELSTSWIALETYLPYLSFHWAPLRAITNGRLKYVEAPLDELYDLKKDPHERVNLAAKRKTLLKDLMNKMNKIIPEPYGKMVEAPRAAIPSEELKELQSLGYIAGGRNMSEGEYAKSLPDPKDLVDITDEILIKSPDLVKHRDYTRLEAMMKGVLKRDRRNLPAIKNLGLAYLGQKRYQEAISLLKQADAVYPNTDYILLSLGEAYSKTGNIQKALNYFEKSYSINPYNIELLGYYAQTLIARREWSHSEKILRFARDNNYENSDIAVGWGLVLMHRKNLQRALKAFNRAIILQRDNPIAHYDRALVYHLMGKDELALSDLKIALRNDPENKQIRNTLKAMLKKMGKIHEAENLSK